MLNLIKQKKIFSSLSLVAVLFTFSLSGCTSDTPDTTDKTDTENATEAEDVVAVADNMLWTNGTYAVLTKNNGTDVTVFGGKEKNSFATLESTTILERDWGITSKEDLDTTIDELRSGMHNVDFIEYFKEVELDQVNREDFDYILTQLDDPEDVAYFSLLYDTYEKLGDNAIMGWDLSRAVSLCGFGYLADYYTYEEATAKAFDIAKQIQTTFDSWDSYYESYMCGYEYWSEDLMLDETSSYNKRRAIIEEFKNDPNSFYNLDWNLDLNAN